MKNPFSSLWQHVINYFCSRRHNPPQQPLSPEQFRTMLLETLNDPETRRLLKPLVGTVFPIQGGQAPRNDYIAKFAGGVPAETATPIFEKDGNKIGIGTDIPRHTLEVRGTGVIVQPNSDISEVFSLQNAAGTTYVDFSTNAASPRLELANAANFEIFSDHFVTSKFKVFGSTGNGYFMGNVGIGTTAPAKKLTVYDGGQDILEVGDANINSIESPATIRYSNRLYPLPLSTFSYTTGLFAKVQPNGQQVFAILGEVDTQPDKFGGFCRVTHKGQGDAFYVALLEQKGVAFEAASLLLHDSQNPNLPGTKGIISTLQTATPATRPNQNNTLFTALWENEYLPNFGMFYASQAPANALLIQKYETDGFTPTGTQTQIRLMENDLGRERFALLNNGTMRWGMSLQGKVTTALLSGGSLLTTRTYYYVVTALDPSGGQSYASWRVSHTPTTNNQKLKLDWLAVTGAASYKIYRADVAVTTPPQPPPAISSFVFLVETSNITYTDDGSVTPSGPAPPATNGAYVAQISTDGPSYLLGGKLGIGKQTPQTALDVGGAIRSTLTTVTFSATPTFDAALGNSFQITLTGNVTGPTISNPQPGQRITFLIKQDGTGNYTFAWPSNVKGGMTISAAGNSVSSQSFLYDGTNWYADSPGRTGM